MTSGDAVDEQADIALVVARVDEEVDVREGSSHRAGTHAISLARTRPSPQGDQVRLATLDVVVKRPTISSITPASAAAGDRIRIEGTGFGSQSFYVFVENGKTNAYATVASWSDTAIMAKVPSLASGTGSIWVDTAELITIQTSTIVPFTVK